MPKKIIHLTEQQLRDVIVETLTETAGVNDESIRLIETEIIPVLSKYRPFNSVKDIPFQFDMPYLGTVNVRILGSESEKKEPQSKMASYNGYTDLLTVRGSHLNLDDWEVTLKSNIEHEITHALQTKGFGGADEFVAKHLSRILHGKDDYSKMMHDLFLESETDSRVGEMYFELQHLFNHIPKGMEERVRENGFVDRMIEHTDFCHKLGQMRAMRIQIAKIQPTYENLPLFIKWSMNINNSLIKTGRKINQKYQVLNAQLSNPNININDIYKQMDSLSCKMKQELLNTMKAIYHDFNDKIHKICDYMLGEYVSNGYKLPSNLWYPDDSVQKQTYTKRKPIFKNENNNIQN